MHLDPDDADSTGRSFDSPRASAASRSDDHDSDSRKNRSCSRPRNARQHKPETLERSNEPTIAPQSIDNAENASAATAAGIEPMPQTDRYQRLGEVGRGGWGVVEKVIDHQLERQVAVKRMTEIEGITEQDRQRFLHEAKVTSQLQHPGIVPVHELGNQQDAFYVMKLLEGITFEQFIEQHHLRPHGQRKPTRFQFGQSLEPLLQRFVDIGNAVAYAHQHGVIHRDLKPSNVMISDFGETVVLDWGLAQSADRNALPGHPTVSTNQHATSTHVSPLLEPDGTVVGTPAYMSPEQAAGDIANLLPTSDIYALGIILYKIVAGRHPYQGLPIDEVLNRVRTASYPDLRTYQPSAPAALIAIIRKATAIKPNDRYNTAEQLVNDIRRFIAGESVSVHRENAVQRGARWCRHHQGITAAVSAAVVLLLIASVGFGVIIKLAHRDELNARIEAQRAHRQTIASLSEARDTTDNWLVEFSGSLQFYPGMNALRGELLERAKKQYDLIAKQSHDTTGPSDFGTSLKTETASDFETATQQIQTLALLEQSKTALRLGDLCRLTENPDEAARHYETAERLLRDHTPLKPTPLVLTVSRTDSIDTTTPGSLSQRLILERIHTLIGQYCLRKSSANGVSPHDVSSPEDSIATARQWLWRHIQTAVNTNQPVHLEMKSFVRRAASALVRLELTVGCEEDTSDLRAIRVARWLASASDAVSDRRLSETVQTDHCQRLIRFGQTEAAAKHWSILIDDLRRWTDASPRRIDYHQSLAHAIMQRANCRVALGRINQAQIDLEESIMILRRARRLTDDDGFYRINLATAENNLGQLLARTGDENASEAARLLQRSLQIYEQSLRQEVTAEGLHRFATTHHALAQLPDQTSEVKNANNPIHIEHARQAVSIFEILQDYQTLAANDRLMWMRCESVLAAHHQQQGNEDAVIKRFNSIDRLQTTLDSMPLTDEHQRELSELQRSITELKQAHPELDAIDTIGNTPMNDMKMISFD